MEGLATELSNGHGEFKSRLSVMAGNTLIASGTVQVITRQLNKGVEAGAVASCTK